MFTKTNNAYYWDGKWLVLGICNHDRKGVQMQPVSQARSWSLLATRASQRGQLSNDRNEARRNFVLHMIILFCQLASCRYRFPFLHKYCSNVQISTYHKIWLTLIERIILVNLKSYCSTSRPIVLPKTFLTLIATEAERMRVVMINFGRARYVEIHKLTITLVLAKSWLHKVKPLSF